MKYLKKLTEGNNYPKLDLQLKHVDIWKPTESDIKKLTEIILSSFTESEILSVNGDIIKARQGSIVKEGSVVDWCMAINEILGNNGEEVMSLFFWQGNNPLEDLLHSINNYEE